MLQYWSTSAVEVSRRNEYLEGLLKSNFCSSRVDTRDGEPDFDARLQCLELGPMNVIRFCGTATHTAQRSLRHVQKDQTDSYLLYLPITAAIDMEQDGMLTRIIPGTFAFVRTSQPFSGACWRHEPAEGAPSEYESLHVRLPAPMVRARIPHLDQYCNRIFPLKPGASRIMATLIESLLLEAEALGRRHVRAVGNSLLEMICAAAQEGIGGAESLAAARDRTMELNRERVKAFIEASLSNPALSTGLIAEKCGMSIRYLHSLFEGQGETVACSVREQRLQKCRSALRDPRMRDVSATKIAFTWGFNDAAHFSRAYRKRFGVAPSEDRDPAGRP
jgi:AraC family transcriptional activator of tynA and feaB